MSFELHPVLERDVSPRPGIWYAVSTEGAPAARVGSTAVQTTQVGRALLCGGASPTEGAFSDLHQLKIDSDSVAWETLPSTSLPPRYEHTLALGPDGSEIFVFAGAQENGPLGDLWTCSSGGGEWREIGEGVMGDPPAPRTHHSSSCVWRERIVVFSGGDCGTNTQDNSIYFFDMVTHAWCKPEVTGKRPSPRQGHILAVVGNRLYVHGGMTAGGEIDSSLYTLDLEELNWSQPHVQGSTPSPALAAHGCAAIRTLLYTFGGLTTNGACNTLYCLDTGSMMWNEVKINGAAPPSRLDHSMTTITLNLPHTPSHSTSSPNSHESHLTHLTTASATPHLVTVLAPEIKDDVTKTNDDVMDKPALQPCDSAQGCGDLSKDLPKNGVAKDEDNVKNKCCGVESGKAESEENSVCCSRNEEGSAGANGGVTQDMVPVNEDGVVTALLVFGGMDTFGNIHSDCFLLVPPPAS